MAETQSRNLKSRIKFVCEEIINLDLPTEKQIAGAIKSSLDAHHGKLNIPSTAKRIKGAIKQAGMTQPERLEEILFYFTICVRSDIFSELNLKLNLTVYRFNISVRPARYPGSVEIITGRQTARW